MTNDEVIDYKSKTEKKREAEALQKLGEKLVKLSNQQFKDIDMPEEVREAVELARTLKSHGARRRQMQYIGNLMRKIDPGTIQEAISDIEEGRLPSDRGYTYLLIIDESIDNLTNLKTK